MKQFKDYSDFLKITKDQKGDYSLSDVKAEQQNECEKADMLIKVQTTSIQLEKKVNACQQLMQLVQMIQQTLSILKQSNTLYDQYDLIKSDNYMTLIELQMLSKYQNDINLQYDNLVNPDHTQLNQKYTQYTSHQIESFIKQRKHLRVNSKDFKNNSMLTCLKSVKTTNSLNSHYLQRLYIETLIKEYEGLMSNMILKSEFTLIIKNPTKINFDLLNQIEEDKLYLPIQVKQNASNQEYTIIGKEYQQINKLIDVCGISFIKVEKLVVDVGQSNFEKDCCMYDLTDYERECYSPAIVSLKNFHTQQIRLSYTNKIYPYQYRKHYFELYLETKSSFIRCEYTFEILDFYSIEDVLEFKLTHFISQGQQSLAIKQIPNIYNQEYLMFILSQQNLDEIEMEEHLLEDLTLLKLFVFQKKQLQDNLLNSEQLLIIDLLFN